MITTPSTPASKTVTLALITGGNRGLGKSMALNLADRGVDVIFTYRSHEDEAEQVVEAIQSKGRKAAALKLDLAESHSFKAFAESLKSTLMQTFDRSQLDALVNNAGSGAHALVAATSEATFDEMVNIHLKGPFFLTQCLLPLLADGGRIINVSTGLTRFSYPGYGAYAAMKGGLEVLTRYLAIELAGRKISVNTVAPGAIATDFGGGAVRNNPELNAMIAGQTALGRVGVADDIGGLVALMLAPESRWINGQRIEASGGINL